MPIDYEIHAVADMLGPGQHTGLACPQCRSDDHALSMLVDPPTIKAICHRASCGFRYSTGHTRSDVVRPSRAHPYTGELRSLDEADYLWFMERFHLHRKALGEVRKSEDRYFLPIFSPEGSRRGWVSRRPWEGSPLNPLTEMGYIYDPSPKSLTYMENEEPVQSWTPRHVGCRRYRVVLVEDQISALRVWQDTASHAVAILGTGVNEEKIAELQRTARNLWIALDPDATGLAFSHARKWGAAFKSCRVIILKKDIKDDTVANIQTIFA